jgi:hypothetical protein
MTKRFSEDLLWSQIVGRAWSDEGFMKRLQSDTRTVLAEHDLEVPEDTEVEVVLGTEVKVEETDRVRHFILPGSPHDDLMEEDLVGGAVSYCAACGRCGCGACRRCY